MARASVSQTRSWTAAGVSGRDYCGWKITSSVPTSRDPMTTMTTMAAMARDICPEGYVSWRLAD